MTHGARPSSGDDEQHAGYGWLAFCAIGMVSSLTMYGIALEYATSGERKLHEWSFVFVTTSIYAITAYIARGIFGEKPTEISKYNMLILSLTSIASTFTSVRSLRYVIYPVQVLFKSCKPVPVMAFNILLGKRYKFTKYVNVIIITAGVGLFMGGGSSSHKGGSDQSQAADTMLMGVLMLSISLCFDGATGAYEDKLMSKNNVEPFDLMYNIQLGKAVLSFCVLIATNGLNDFLHTIDNGGFSLVLLGLTGAIGQVNRPLATQLVFFVLTRTLILNSYYPLLCI
jgi:solute carrier family 35 (UDP-galactose transporter), member B1